MLEPKQDLEDHRGRHNHPDTAAHRMGTMYADSTKLAAPLEDKIAVLKGRVETEMDIGRKEPRAMAGGLAYLQPVVPGVCTDTEALIAEEEICIEHSGLGTDAGGESHQAAQRWIRRQHDACRGG